MQGVLVSFSLLVRMMVVGFVAGVVVGWYVFTGGPDAPGSATCHPGDNCGKTPVTSVNPEAAP